MTPVEARRDTAASFAAVAVWAPIAAGALTLGLTALFPVWTNDLFGHMAAGRQILELGRVPHHDTFSFYFDHPRPWRNHNWASGVLFYALYQGLGADALVCLKVVLCAALGALLVATCARRGWAASPCALVLLWAVPSVRPRFTVRPHLFGLLFCAALLYALLALARMEPKRRTWPIYVALGALQVVWVNLHGSAPMAFLLTGAFVLGHHGDALRQRRYLVLLFVQLVASCVTPFGPWLMLETFNHVSSEGTRFFISEWEPLGASDNAWDVPACTAALMLTMWVAVPLWRSGAAGRSWLLVLMGLFVMAFRSLRFVAEPLLLGAPCLATGLALHLSGMSARAQRVASVGGVVLAGLGLVSIAIVGPNLPPYQPVGLGLSPRNLPMEPGRWLAAHRPRARIVGLMEDCWYLSFAVPEGRVIVDGRQAVYPLEVLMSVFKALAVPSQLFSLLEQKRADAVVLRHTRVDHAASTAALLQRSDYRVATVGDRHVLFVRDLDPERAIVALWPNLALRSFDAAQASRATRELERIGSRPGSSEYVGYQRALLAISPYLRSGGHDGLHFAADAVQREHYARALRELEPALVPDENLPAAQILAAMLNLELCRANEAERHLGLARAESENRYTVALRIELALRQGRPDEARRLLGDLHAPGPDGWLDALRQELSGTRDRPRCPPMP